MTAQTKLTETQIVILKAATGRPDGNIEPLPTNLRGGARPKVIEGLLAKGLVTDADGCHLLTDAGYAAVGKRRPGHKGVQKADALNAVAKRDTTDALQKLEATPPTIRPGTKLASIIDTMRRPRRRDNHPDWSMKQNPTVLCMSELSLRHIVSHPGRKLNLGRPMVWAISQSYCPGYRVSIS